MPLQSELVLHPPHLPLEHEPVLQSELVLQWLQVPPEHVPWPLQSELVLQWPHWPLEHVPKPAQSDVVLQNGSACDPNTAAGEPWVMWVASFALSASNDGTGTADVLA